jgi:hypothetical protein
MKNGWKKSAAALLLSTMVVGSIPAVVSASSAGVSVTINGTSLASAANHIAGGKVYVDLKSFSSFTGIAFTYDSKKHTASVNGHEVKVTVSKGVPTVYIKDLAKAAGAGLTWNGSTHTAQLSFKSQLLVLGDVVSSNGGCVVQNRFTVGDGIVFRMKAVNPITGKLVENAKLQVHLGTGEVLDMKLGQHPPDAPQGEKFWTVNYKVTDATPKGTLSYYVTAQTATMKGEYKPFQVMPSLITIVAPESGDAEEPTN